jgi:hypothetical protein
MKYIKPFHSLNVYEDLDSSTKKSAFVKLERGARELLDPKHSRRLDQLSNIYRSLSGPSEGLKEELKSYIENNLGVPGVEIISRNLSIRFEGRDEVELIIKDSKGSILLHILVNSRTYSLGSTSDKDFTRLSTNDEGFNDLVDRLVKSIQERDIYLEK